MKTIDRAKSRAEKDFHERHAEGAIDSTGVNGHPALVTHNHDSVDATTLRDLAIQASRKSDDARKAADVLNRLLKLHPDLDLDFTKRVRMQALTIEIHQARYAVRESIKSFTGNGQAFMRPGELSASRIAESAAACSILRDWKIGDTALGDCTREQISAAADQDEQQAKGHLENVSFYRLIVKSMTDKQKMKDAWKERDAHKLWTDIRSYDRHVMRKTENSGHPAVDVHLPNAVVSV